MHYIRFLHKVDSSYFETPVRCTHLLLTYYLPLTMMHFGDGFIVNGFMFCTLHGREFCNTCCSDHRPCNNMRADLDADTYMKLRGLSLSADVRTILFGASQRLMSMELI